MSCHCSPRSCLLQFQFAPKELEYSQSSSILEREGIHDIFSFHISQHSCEWIWKVKGSMGVWKAVCLRLILLNILKTVGQFSQTRSRQKTKPHLQAAFCFAQQQWPRPCSFFSFIDLPCQRHILRSMSSSVAGGGQDRSIKQGQGSDSRLPGLTEECGPLARALPPRVDGSPPGASSLCQRWNGVSSQLPRAIYFLSHSQHSPQKRDSARSPCCVL